MTAILGRMATYTGRTVAWDEAFNCPRSLAPPQIVDWRTEPLTQPNADGSYPLPAPGVVRTI